MGLSIERAALIVYLSMHNYDDDQIAGLLQVTRATVQKVKYGTDRNAKIRAAREQGKSISQLANEFQISRPRVKYILSYR